MPWLQTTFDTTRDEAQRLSDALEEAGALSVSLEGADAEPLFETDWNDVTPVWKLTRVVALFSEDADVPAAMRMVAALLSLPAVPKFKTETIADQDWVRVWMDRWRPMHFGANLWVVPSWLTPPDPDAANIILDPGMAFGTGTHATTAMCLEWLAAHPPRDLDVIDYGCGSGILAIAAIKLGAKRVLAVDIDPQALDACKSNMAMNAIEPERIPTCLPQALGADAADLLMANILAGPLLELLQRFAGLVRPGGKILLSGILRSQQDEIQSAYNRYFEMEPARQRDEWVCLGGKRREIDV